MYPQFDSFRSKKGGTVQKGSVATCSAPPAPTYRYAENTPALGSDRMSTTRPRYAGLDQLRGVLACGVMAYHFLHWCHLDETLTPWVRQPLELVGLYAVATFYALSGAALAVVYAGRTVDQPFLAEFALKRAFRILPLCWLVTTAALALNRFVPIVEQPGRVLLCYSMLFSWVDPTAYYAVGAWSIGNEWAFYTLFPIFLWAFRRAGWIGGTAALVITITSAYWWWFQMRSDVPVGDQWAMYIHPINQWALFAGGMGVARLIAVRRSFAGWAVIALGTLAFLAIAWSSDPNRWVYGGVRVALVGVAIAWCYGAGRLPDRPSRLGHVVTWLGDRSYAIYLLHPFAYRFTRSIMNRLPSGVERAWEWLGFDVTSVLMAAVAALAMAHVSFLYFERPLVRWGRSLIGSRGETRPLSVTPKAEP